MYTYLTILLISLSLSINSICAESDVELYKGNDAETEKVLYSNFNRVLSAMMTSDKASSLKVRKAVNTVMRELLYEQPLIQGYKKQLFTQMLQVKSKPTKNQLIRMFEIMDQNSPPDSEMSKAAKIVLEWLQSDNGKKFIDQIYSVVKNLFQRTRDFLPKVPSASGNELNPAVLPADINDISEFDLRSGVYGEKYGNGGSRYGNGGYPPNHRPGDNYNNNNRYPEDRYPIGDKYPGGDRRPGNRYPESDRYPENRPVGRPPQRPINNNGNYPPNHNHNHNHREPTGEKICIERLPPTFEAYKKLMKKFE